MRMRLAAKAAKTAKNTMAAQALNTNEGARIVLTINTNEGARIMLTIKGPPQNTGAIPKTKSSTTSRQKMPKAGQGSSHGAKGPGGLNP
jgi:hypothetical protein